jgi:hypothetical protein
MRLRLAFRCRRISSAGRRFRQVLDLCARIIEHNDRRFVLERNSNFRDARNLLDRLFHHVKDRLRSTCCLPKMMVRCSAIAAPEKTMSNPSAREVVNFVINLSIMSSARAQGSRTRAQRRPISSPRRTRDLRICSPIELSMRQRIAGSTSDAASSRTQGRLQRRQ